MLKYIQKYKVGYHCMGILQRKLIIIIMLACGILAYSCYSFVQKTSADRALNTAAPSPETLQNSNPTPAGKGADDEVVVYVSGGVSKPGVYKLFRGSRVVDAVALAGGFMPGADAAKINLAMLLKDEMQIHVPYAAIPVSNNPGVAAPANANTGSSGDKVNINTASKEELDKLPGIGPAIAERIIEYRTNIEPFRDIADIKKVPGIGEAKYNQFKNKISL